MQKQNYKKFLNQEDTELMGKYARYFIAGMLIFFVIVILGCHFVLKDDYKNDNVIEELIEEGIKQQTGLDLDLTPNSMET